MFIVLLFIWCINTITIAQNSKPNILLLVVDDLGWTDISHHGAEYSTPNIDSLFSNGVELTNYYVQSTCSPTRSSIMTGKYSWKTGLQSTSTISPGTTEHIPFQFPTMPQLLSSSGYKTHALGKWHLGYAAFNMTPTGRGFDSHFGYYQGQETYYSHHLWTPEQPQYEGFDFWFNKTVYFQAVGNYSTKLYENQMEIIITNHVNNYATDPLFIYMAFQTNHVPVLDSDGTPENPPKTYTECSTNTDDLGRQTYCNKMKYLDEQIGSVINLYKTKGLYDNTLIALTTDNGGMPFWDQTRNVTDINGTRGISWGCNYPFRAGKGTDFQGGIHGIGVLSGGLIEKLNLGGTKSNILSHAMDWVATFVEGVAGDTLPNDKEFDSMNMMNGIGIGTNSNWNRTALFVDIQTNDRLFTVLNDTLSGHIYKLINASGFKYWDWYLCNGTIENANIPKEYIYLFDIVTDPFERNNLYSTYPDIADELAEMVKKQLQNGGYYPEQSKVIYNQSLPEYNDGVWAPWLN